APRTLVTSDFLASTVNELDCDALFIVGDTVDRSENVKLVTELFKQIHVRGPKLAVFGNWEHWAGIDLDELSAAYGEADVRLLVNQTFTFELGATRMTVVGLDDLVGGYPKFDLVKGTSELLVILAHCPASFNRIHTVAGGPTLTFSGHTHGGQIAPLGFALWLPPGSGRYVSGWYDVGSHMLFVTRGLGNSVVPFRIGSAPELSIIHLS
ncbi:MAG: metallophosphoesterase, partial [Candidatus Bathyarchaeia archaeon]